MKATAIVSADYTVITLSVSDTEIVQLLAALRQNKNTRQVGEQIKETLRYSGFGKLENV